MRRLPDGSWKYSPTDLVRFYGSPFVSSMDRLTIEQPGRFERDPEREEDKIVAQLGVQHEEAHAERLTGEGRRIFEILRGDASGRDTVAAMRRGEDVIFQGALELLPFTGYADFIERTPGASALGDFHYEVADTKLSASAKPGHLIQLCAYAEMLEAVQGRRPEHVHVVLRGGVRQTFRTDDYFFAYRRIKRAFLHTMSAFGGSPPEPDLGGDWDAWTSEARRWLEASDHLALVAGIRTDQIRKFHALGVRTMADLAAIGAARVRGISGASFDRLRVQSRLQIASRGKDVPAWVCVTPPATEPRRGLAALPPASPLDVYFDMEGYPFVEGGLEYLFGAVGDGEAEPEYRDWWAHDGLGERRALEGFVRWVQERRERDPGMHVYHYAPYERSALRRLMGRYATCEDDIDSFLRDGVLVDLYAVVRQGIRVGAPSYSIKALEVLYGRSRSTEVRTGGDSIVAYHRWLESGEPRDPAFAPLLASIRDYNREDCLSTRDLARWLRDRQRETGIAWLAPEPEPEEPPSARREQESARRAVMRTLATAMLQSIPGDPIDRARDADRWRVTEVLAHLIEFHRREAKPVWWSLFDRDAMDDDERTDDPTCLANLVREAGPLVPIQRSKGWWYRFDPQQETRIGAESGCCLVGSLAACTVQEMDEENGRILLKFGDKALARLPGGEPPDETSLLLHEHVRSDAIEDSISRSAAAWHGKGELRPAIRDLLLRRRPNLGDGHLGPLVAPDADATVAAVALVGSLRDSVLCIQGPPGTGKTYTAAQAIAALVRSGRRVALASNSHKAILNLLDKCAEALGGRFSCMKVGSPDDEDDAAFAAAHPGTELADPKKALERLGEHHIVGGTAWFFSREAVIDRFEILFVDEAGQVSLANMVGMAPCARSLVLLGDPMQLPQPTQGVHPGESGLSALDYALAGHATVPADFGVFLPVSRRLHPRLCAFVGGAFYEDRLRPLAGTENRVIRSPSTSGVGGESASSPDAVPIEAGLLFIPVGHEGNAQTSDEEVHAIASLLALLVGRRVTDDQGRDAGALGLADIVIVAPYNLQVRALRAGLPKGARIGTVDKFQGQEARASIVSLTASDAEAATRGLEFVLDRRRLNVAISRAQSLSIVVGSPSLARTRCRTIAQMGLLNTLCRIAESATVPEGGAW